jgi:hypothetical protein
MNNTGSNLSTKSIHQNEETRHRKCENMDFDMFFKFQYLTDETEYIISIE